MQHCPAALQVGDSSISVFDSGFLQECFCAALDFYCRVCLGEGGRRREEKEREES